MDIVSLIIIVAGLCLFEIISSIDNAIINAEVLSTMQAKARKWFLVWGIFFAVFVVRGALPLFIVWITNPGLGFFGAFTATLSSDPAVLSSLEHSAPFLLLGGGTFLILLFFHWLFMEEKNYAFLGEKLIHENGMWFFTVASVFLAWTVWMTQQIDPRMPFAAVLGSTVFFITNGFKANAELQEKKLMKGTLSDISKIVYLEAIDATFSIDGVLGAFAFTLAVPLILIGNGLGAFVVRQLTIGNIHRIKKYAYLKNGAMYSILVLGCVMLAEGFGAHVNPLVSPILTFVIVGYFFFKSTRITLQPAG
ncbi:DUF475 domain-containing protein [Candidatus Uhrbacteria bacterium]|nr:DUF475 domain-containing protein [Candidatus Uhrbacteria bacterium]